MAKSMSAFGISLFLLFATVNAGSIVQQTRQLKLRSQKQMPEAPEAIDRNEQEAPTREELLAQNAQNPPQVSMGDNSLPPALDASMPAFPAAQQELQQMPALSQLQQMQQMQQLQQAQQMQQAQVALSAASTAADAVAPAQPQQASVQNQQQQLLQMQMAQMRKMQQQLEEQQKEIAAMKHQEQQRAQAPPKAPEQQRAPQQRYQAPTKSLVGVTSKVATQSRSQSNSQSGLPIPGIVKPKGWDQCLKFARYVKAQEVTGVELVRTWKSTCEPAVQSGRATERYKLMCNSLSGVVEPYAAQIDYNVEQLCDAVLAVFHDVTAIDASAR